jgi:hypothetical protein
MALGRSKDPAALPYLAAVVRTDPDPELRDLARKAGQYIQAQTKGTAAPTAGEPPAPGKVPPIQPLAGIAPAAKPAAPPKKPSAFSSDPIDEPDMGYLTRSYSEYEQEDAAALGALGAAAGVAEAATGADAPAPLPTGGKRGKTPVRGQTYAVSEANQRRAKDILEAALTANINNDNARAMRYLYQSLMMDPNLINDGYYAQIAGGVTEAPRDEAIQMIIDQGERKSFIKTQEKAVRDERKNKHLSEARRSNWTAVAVDLLIYLLINILGPLALFFAVAESLGSLDPALQAELAREGVTAGFSFVVYLPLIVGSAVGALVSLLVQAAVIHIVARYLLGGVGTFANLLTRLLGLYNRMLIVIYGISFVAVIVTFILQFSPLALCFMLPLVGASLYLGIKTLAVVGEAYDFGVLMGCISVLAGTLIITVVTLLLSWAAVSTLIQQFQTLLETMPAMP